MDRWQKTESLSKIAAALLIPLAIAWLANAVSLSNKQRDAEIKFVEIASAVLNKEPATDQSAGSKSLRKWAIDILNKYSGVKMSPDTEDALVNSESLPSAAKFEGPKNLASEADTWGLIFGGDTTLEAAQHEKNVTAKKIGISNSEIFRRAGSFRSVKVFVNRAEAEDSLGRANSVRPDAYIVNMSKWCPTSTNMGAYFECN